VKSESIEEMDSLLPDTQEFMGVKDKEPMLNFLQDIEEHISPFTKK
jgi:hypothetical protein